jgi:hypothetical protein
MNLKIENSLDLALVSSNHSLCHTDQTHTIKLAEERPTKATKVVDARLVYVQSAAWSTALCQRQMQCLPFRAAKSQKMAKLKYSKQLNRRQAPYSAFAHIPPGLGSQQIYRQMVKEPGRWAPAE